MASPYVSIIVPVYNGASYIDAFYSCLKKQSYSNYEVILVDDGSTDDTYEKCFLYAKNDASIKLFHKDNGGPGSARNYGIKKAGGEYVAFFDIDDEFDGNVLKDNIEIALKGDLDVVMWNFTMMVLSTGGKYYRQIGCSCSVGREEFFRRYLIPTLDNEMFNPSWNKLIRRKLLLDNNVCFHTEYSLYEDILFSYDVFKKARSIAINDDSYYTYIIKSKGSLLTKYHPECFEAILSIYKTAMEYCSYFDDNTSQVKRINEQFIYLTRGYIKQICVNKEISKAEKTIVLSEIGNNPEFRTIGRYTDRGIRRIPARVMMNSGLYDCIIIYYNAINFFKKQ